MALPMPTLPIMNFGLDRALQDLVSLHVSLSRGSLGETLHMHCLLVFTSNSFTSLTDYESGGEEGKEKTLLASDINPQG